MSHGEHDIFENRKEFQLDRMILFSDAVFAIAITLLIIEVKVPQLNNPATFEKDMPQALLDIWPQFFGLIMSFAVVGLFWVQHHRLFGLVTAFDNKLIWLNLHLLFWVILIPFSSSMNSIYGGVDFVWECYSLNMFMIAMSIFFLWNYIGNPQKKLSALAHDSVRKKYAVVRSLSVAFIFLLGFLISLGHTRPTKIIAHSIFCLIFPVMMIISKKYKRYQDKKNPA